MITYSTENVKFPNIKRRETTAWIRRVAATYGKKVGEVGYLFCDDEHIIEVNREYLGHDYYTDIITFDWSSHWIPFVRMPNYLKKIMMRNYTVSLSTVFCTYVA